MTAKSCIGYSLTVKNTEMDNTTYNPLVSIITPILNNVEFLEPCIESVLNQSYPHIEHIFIDGGSTDGTVDMLSRYSTKYPDRVRFISEPDEGRDDAANKGVQIARGEIFGALGSNDTMEPEAIQTAVDFFRSNPDAYFVYGDCNLIDEKGEVVRKFPTKDFNLKKLINKSPCISTTSAFYKRAVFEKVGLYYIIPEAALISDFDFQIRVGKAFQVYRIYKVLSSFRMHHWTFSDDSWQRTKMVIRRSYLLSRRHGGSFFSWYARTYYESLIIDWLRPILSPIYPFIEKVVDKYRFRKR